MTSIIKVNTIQDVGGNNLLISNGSGTITTNNIGGQNTPTVMAHQSSDQNLTKGTDNKIVNLTTTVDTNSAFSSNKFTVPSGEGGNYLVNWQLTFDGDSSGNSGYDLNRMSIYKNGSEFIRTDHVREPQIPYGSFLQSATIALSASDYLEFYFHPDRGGGTAGDTKGTQRDTFITILKLIGA